MNLTLVFSQLHFSTEFVYTLTSERCIRYLEVMGKVKKERARVHKSLASSEVLQLAGGTPLIDRRL